MKMKDTKEAVILTLKNTKRKMPRVPARLRERALSMLQGEMRTAVVASAINCNVRIVRRPRQRYRETGRTADCPRSGRPRVTTPAQDRYIRTSHLRDRYSMATTTARVTPGMHNPAISAQAVRNRLREAGLRACRPVVRQVLTRHYRQQCHLLAQTHHRWTRQDWQKVLFTDDSWFCLTRGDGLICVYHRRNEHYTEVCTLQWDRFGGGGPSWSGAVSQHHRTELVVIAGNLNAVHYREDILLPHLVPFLQAHPDMTLQHDNATSHNAHSVCDFPQDKNVLVLPWPAKSPDLNPIKHVWDLLDWRVRARAIPPRNVQELAGALVEEWGNISQQELANLVQSMRRRCTAIINAAGGQILTVTFDPPFVQGHIIQFLLVTCLWNLFSLCLSCCILCSYKYLHMLSLLKINTVDSEDVSFFLQ
uniref:Tc1-like transposase DDE domain-containing protein n=1 Tax=Oncorhynchus mykiss TaxID=8022 RepID=A0A8K9UFN3_ONCMY